MLTCPLWNEVFPDHLDKINNPALKHPLPPSLLSFSPWHWSLIWQHFRVGLSARTWLCTALYPQCLVRCLLPRKGFVIICWKSDWDCLGSFVGANWRGEGVKQEVIAVGPLRFSWGGQGSQVTRWPGRAPVGFHLGMEERKRGAIWSMPLLTWQ